MKYRMYESFLTQLGISYLFSLSVTVDWHLPWINQALIYIYWYIRFYLTFDEIPKTLWIALILTTISYSFGCYMLSLTLKREFLAIYTQKKSAESFHKTCSALPDGVAIIDNNNSKCNFINPHLKNLFDLRLYWDQRDNIMVFNRIKDKIDKDFEEAMDILSENKTEFEAQTDINHLMDELIIVKNEQSESKFYHFLYI